MQVGPCFQTAGSPLPAGRVGFRATDFGYRGSETSLALHGRGDGRIACELLIRDLPVGHEPYVRISLDGEVERRARNRFKEFDQGRRRAGDCEFGLGRAHRGQQNRAVLD